jgi:endonuclease IV
MTQVIFLKLANSGDMDAINTLVNQSFSLPNITVKTSLKKKCLQIMLELIEVIKQKSVVEMIWD